MVRHYCTDCLSLYGKYYDLKCLYERIQGKFVPSRLYQCSSCLTIAAQNYDYLREIGRHIVRKFEEVRET